MERSEQINELAAALAKAQAEIKGAAKDADNPHFRSKYADLASVWDACRAALTRNGLAVVQTVAYVEGEQSRVEVTTMLCHSSGQWVSGTLGIPCQKDDAHGVGSATTYGRRFSLAAMVGVAPEDDDGNGAVSGTRAPNSGRLMDAPEVRDAVDEQQKERAALVKWRSAMAEKLAPPEESSRPAPGKLGKEQKDGTFTCVGEMLKQELRMWESMLERDLGDPKKANFKAANEADLKAIKGELAWRKAVSE